MLYVNKEKFNEKMKKNISRMSIILKIDFFCFNPNIKNDIYLITNILNTLFFI